MWGLLQSVQQLYGRTGGFCKRRAEINRRAVSGELFIYIFPATEKLCDRELTFSESNLLQSCRSQP